MPNLFAQLVLYSYPLVVMVLFRRLPRHEALIWTILGGYLFLPEQTGIDLPLLPELNKVLIPSLTAAIMCLALPDATALPRRRGQARDATDARPAGRQRSLIAIVCLIVLFLAPIGIFQSNQEPVIAGPRFIGGLRIYDIFSMLLNTGVMLLPFLLARHYLTSREAQLALLRALVVGGLIYSVLILIEVRLSPQLNRWIYGFHGHSFAQHVRGGGYRPMVFIEHGLRVGIFMVMSVFAAAILWRYHKETPAKTPAPSDGRRARAPARNRPYLMWCGWLFVVLFLSKTLGAFMIATVLLPVVLFLKARTQILVAVSFAGIVLVYPMLRQADVIPVDAVYNFAESIDPERADSFKYRLDNEDILLVRADQKPVFGWGGWGRSRIYDPVSGKDLSVTDGSWVIAFGVSGWVGYLAQFGLLTLPFLIWLRRRATIDLVTSGFCLILVANLVDLIPNSSLTPLTWLYAGMLLGHAEHSHQPKDAPRSSRSGPDMQRARGRPPQSVASRVRPKRA